MGRSSQRRRAQTHTSHSQSPAAAPCTTCDYGASCNPPGCVEKERNLHRTDSCRDPDTRSRLPCLHKNGEPGDIEWRKKLFPEHKERKVAIPRTVIRLDERMHGVVQ